MESLISAKRADKGIQKRFCFWQRAMIQSQLSQASLHYRHIFTCKIQQVKQGLGIRRHLLNNHSILPFPAHFNSPAVLSNLQLVSSVPSTKPLTEHILGKHACLNEAEDIEVTWLHGSFIWF